MTYNGNGNTGGTVPTDATNYQQGQTVTVLGNTGTLVKTGYTFAGWNTLANGSGTTYSQGQTFTIGSANVILYAVWTTISTYTVTYDANGATGGTVPTDSTNYQQGQTVTVLDNTGSLVRTHYSFAGWNTASDGSGTTYTQSQTFAMGTANVILYAKWTANPTFAYVANSGGNNVSAYTIDASTGALTEITGSPFADGTNPYSVTVDPTCKFAYVANYYNGTGGNSVSAYTINASTGALTAITGSPFAAGSSPMSVTVDPTGKFAYVTNVGDDNVSGYTINASTGALTEITGSPFNAGSSPNSIITVIVSH